MIPAETDLELESRGAAGLTVSASRDLSKQTCYIPTLPRSGAKKGMMEVEPVNRMCSVGSRAHIPVNGTETGADTYCKATGGINGASAVRENDGRCARAVLRSSIEN